MASDDLFLLEVNFEEPNDSANSEESNASPKSVLMNSRLSVPRRRACDFLWIRLRTLIAR